MKNPEIDRLEAKLKLWETPGFSQFVNDLSDFCGSVMPIEYQVAGLKAMYQLKLKDIQVQEEKEAKFKQTKLDI